MKNVTLYEEHLVQRLDSNNYYLDKHHKNTCKVFMINPIVYRHGYLNSLKRGAYSFQLSRQNLYSWWFLEKS